MSLQEGATMNEVRYIETDEEIKIFSDPYRMKIINAYIKAGQPMTVKGVADMMGEVPAKVHYHVKKLISIDILRLDHTEVINGITAKYYALTTDSFRVAYQNTSDQKALFDSTTNMILSVVDEFKGDIVNNAEFIKSHKAEEKAPKNAFFTKESISLNEQDYVDFEREVRELYKKYRNKPDGEKKTYDFFVGWFRRYD